MKRVFLSLLFLLAGASIAEAQIASEIANGGGGGVSTAPGSGTAGVVPQFVSATSLADSKMLTSGTNSGTWTLYDDTATNGHSQLTIRMGTAQSMGGKILEIVDNAGASLTGGYGLVSRAPDGILLSFRGAYHPARVHWMFDDGGFRVSTSSTYGFSQGAVDYDTVDVALQRSGTGTVKVTNGSTGQGGIGLEDTATATVSDALILRHASSSTTALGFGTGLRFEGENDGGAMHAMARIEAYYQSTVAGSETAYFKFYNYETGTENYSMSLGRLNGVDNLSAQTHFLITSAGNLQLGSATQVSAAISGVNIIGVNATGLFPFTTNTYDIGTSSALVRNIYASGLQVSDSAEAAVSDAIILRHDLSSDTATVGMGTGLLFQGENAAGTMHDMASIQAVYSDVTDASEDANLVFRTVKAGTVTTLATLTAVGSVAAATQLDVPGGYSISTDSALNLVSSGASVDIRAAGPVNLYSGSVARWQVEPNLVPLTTNTYDIGTSSATVKDFYIAGRVRGVGGLIFNSTGNINFEKDGVGGIFTMLGDRTSMYPALDAGTDLGTSTQRFKNFYVSTSIQGTRTQAISAEGGGGTEFVEIAVASGASVGGFIEYTVQADDGTDREIESGIVSFTATNEAGTEAANVSILGTPAETPGAALTVSFDVTTGLTNVFRVKVISDSPALVPTTHKIEYRVHVNSGTTTVTPLT